MLSSSERCLKTTLIFTARTTASRRKDKWCVAHYDAAQLVLTTIHLKSLEDYDENYQEELPEPEPELNSPVVGEKRQREEDEHEEQETRQSANDANKSDTAASAVSSATANTSNGSTNGTLQATQNSSAVSAPMGGGAGSVGSNFDALYIGDLQWVCSFCFYGFQCSETIIMYSLYTVDYG